MVQDQNGMRDPLRLAELLAARLCHDLSGPLGTLMSALELATEDVAEATEALALANEVSVTMGKRLRLLRAAWGTTTPSMGATELRAMAEGMQRGRRLQLDFDALDPTRSFTPPAARVMLNVLLLAMESLPSGGMVGLAGDPCGDVVVTIAGPRAAWPPRLAGFLADESQAWQALHNGEDIDVSRGLLPLVTALLAHTAGLRLSLLMAAVVETAPPLLLRLGDT